MTLHIDLHQQAGFLACGEPNHPSQVSLLRAVPEAVMVPEPELAQSSQH